MLTGIDTTAEHDDELAIEAEVELLSPEQRRRRAEWFNRHADALERETREKFGPRK